MSNEILSQIESVYEGARKHRGFNYIQSLAQNISKEFDFDYVLIGRPNTDNQGQIDTLVVVNKDNILDNFSYDLEGTPCKKVLGEVGACCYPKNVAKLFPEDLMLGEMGIESYSGVAIVDADESLLGIFIILNERRIEEENKACMIVEYFGSRIAMELTQQYFQEKLTMKNLALEKSKKELLKSKQRTEILANAKSEFLANMSHEIRTPMNGVIGMVSLLEETQLSKEQNEMLDTIKNSGETLLSLIDDILDYSKIESGKIELVPTEVDLKILLSSLISMLQAHGVSLGVIIKSTIDPKITKNIEVDDIRLKQILMNLLSNSLKFSEGRQSIQFDITVLSESDTHYDLSFAIKDQGIGISKDQQKNLFESFTQSDSTVTRRYGGTGLGLAITKKLVDLMGGEIEVKSELGEGATFTVQLSLPKSKQVQRAINAKHLSDKNDFAGRFKHKILVVEDNKVNQTIALMMLKKLGYQADLAEDGLEAVNCCHQIPYSLVLMDMQMPVLDGISATARITTELGEQAPIIIAMTANVLENDRKKCLESGMKDFLSKPVKLDDLAKMIEKNTDSNS